MAPTVRRSGRIQQKSQPKAAQKSAAAGNTGKKKQAQAQKGKGKEKLKPKVKAKTTATVKAKAKAKAKAKEEEEREEEEKAEQPQTGKKSEKSGKDTSKKRKRTATTAAATGHASTSANAIKRPTKKLVTAKDRGIQHWINSGKLPGLSTIDPTYAPYCARLRRHNLISTRSGSLRLDKDEDADADADTLTRAQRKAIYATDGNCPQFLADNGVHLSYTKVRPTEASRAQCKELDRENKNIFTPDGTAFDKEKANDTFTRLQWRNEAAIIRVIGELIVPSIQTVADDLPSTGMNLEYSVDEPWNLMIPLEQGVPPLLLAPAAGDGDDSAGGMSTLPAPQPDYAVGFSRVAFTGAQHALLESFLGRASSATVASFFRPTARLYFPFLTSEVRQNLDIADNQNAHTMALCIRGIVYLYRLAGRENELDRQILGFSIAYNSTAVRIYGHYPVISKEDGGITYHHHDIATYMLMGKNRWRAWWFVMSVYRNWAPEHLDRIRAIVEFLPEDINLAVPAAGDGVGAASGGGGGGDVGGAADETEIPLDEWPSVELPNSEEWDPSRGGADSYND
ncbi:hypothetical protein BJX64DRAFT_287743 [Aspergillus heterothallicus]